MSERAETYGAKRKPLLSRRQVKAMEERIRARIGVKISEDQFLAQVRELAAWNGWKIFHTYDSRRSEFGSPDLVLVRAGRLLFAEIKSATGPLKAEQREWLSDLKKVPGVEVFTWRPADLEESGKILAR